MQKLSKVYLRDPFDPGSDDPQFRADVLVAGVGRTKPQNGGTWDGTTMVPNPDLPVTDVELEDDPISRRVYVRSPGLANRFVPYEMVRFGEEISEPPGFAKDYRVLPLPPGTVQAGPAEESSVGTPVPIQAGLTCANCGKVFTGPKAAQELGGHRRHCKGAA